MRSTFRGPLVASLALHAGVMLAACFAPAMLRQPAAEVVLPVFVLLEEPKTVMPTEVVAAPPPVPPVQPEAPPAPCVAPPLVEAVAAPPREPVVCAETISHEERPAEEASPQATKALAVAMLPPAQLAVEPEVVPAAPSPLHPEPLAGNPQPVYPAVARRAGHEGLALLRVAVDARGRVADASVAASSGHPLLDAAATRAVKQWRFRPAMREGGAVEGELRVPVRFSLRNEP